MIALIVGLGLIGGSFGIALRDVEYFDKIIGFDNNSTHLSEALELKLVDEISTDLEESFKIADLIILAVPVDAIIKILNSIKNIKESCTIIDLGSTKSKIVNSTPLEIRKNFIPAHPMAGTEKVGPSSAFKGLFKNKIMVVCDLEYSGEHQKSLALDIFHRMEMRIIKMNSKEHDKHAAFISHLPHAISYALANTVLAQEDKKSILTLAAGGFRDMSRIAKSSPNMWCDIFKQNKNHILDSIEIFESELQKSKEYLINEDWDKLYEWMDSATKLHDIL